MQFSNLGLNSPVHASFCGSHVGMKLPILCRQPENGFDYGVQFPHRIAARENPASAANTGDWSCHSTPASTRFLLSPPSPGSRQMQKQEESSSPKSVKEFFEITETFKIEVTPVYTTSSTNACGADKYVSRNTCWAACCDSEYRYSEFCRQESLTCY